MKIRSFQDALIYVWRENRKWGITSDDNRFSPQVFLNKIFRLLYETGSFPIKTEMRTIPSNFDFLNKPDSELTERQKQHKDDVLKLILYFLLLINSTVPYENVERGGTFFRMKKLPNEQDIIDIILRKDGSRNHNAPSLASCFEYFLIRMSELTDNTLNAGDFHLDPLSATKHLSDLYICIRYWLKHVKIGLFLSGIPNIKF
ncbi:MAG TPA: hypothetical protein VGE63_01200 [Candidatus Paceibacterota bacterium]